MMLKLLVILVGIFAALVGHAAEAVVSGVIRICRVAGEGESHRDKAIEIPMGAAFGDTDVVNGPDGGGMHNALLTL